MPPELDRLIDPVYLPFTAGQLARHFTGATERHTQQFEASAKAYREFLNSHSPLEGVAIDEARASCQIEKDERCWTATALKRVFDAPARKSVLIQLLSRAFGPTPPCCGLETWEDCLSGELRLVFEAALPSPTAYQTWLREHRREQHIIPYTLRAGDRRSLRSLEGPTKVDALLVNLDNGFALLVEAKVMSDLSGDVSFDAFRNQFARNVDVMLEAGGGHPWLAARRADRSLFTLLTPRCFQQRPHSRLYGFLYEEYTQHPAALARDLPHRTDCDWSGISRRIGWLTFEDINDAQPGACPWME